MNQNPNFGGALLGALVCILVVVAIVLAIYIFFCLTLSRTLTAVHPRNRLIAPGLVWLHLLHLGGFIPLLGILFGIAASIWDLIMVLKIAGSLKKEFEDRDWRTEDEGFGRIVGLVWTIGALAGLPVGLAMNLLGNNLADPTIAIVFLVAMVAYGLTMLICFILYWVQIAGYGRRLREGRGRYRTGGIEDDYDDEFRAPRFEQDNDDFDDRPRRRDRDDD